MFPEQVHSAPAESSCTEYASDAVHCSLHAIVMNQTRLCVNVYDAAKSATEDDREENESDGRHATLEKGTRPRSGVICLLSSTIGNAIVVARLVRRPVIHTSFYLKGQFLACVAEFSFPRVRSGWPLEAVLG